MINILSMVKEDFPHINAISINQHGEPLLKEYFNGFNNNDIFKVGCIFKSILSAMVGISIKDNKIQSLDQKILDYYPAVRVSEIDKNFTLLTLKHVMTKTSGINWPSIGEKIPLDMQEVFTLKFKDIPGENFEYKPDPQIMIYLIEDLYAKSIINIVDDKLFRPLGIKNWEWSRDDIENMKISVDDLTLLGQLYLNKGNYLGKCYFKEEFYIDSIYPYSNGGFPEGKPYGYYWWIDKYQDIEYYCSCGFGGQKLCIIPSLDTSIIIISKMDAPHLENNTIIRNTISMLKES
jgi:CubicO group peptidase (beta-lactamase class C family)